MSTSASLSSQRVQKTSDVVKEGDKVKVKLLGFDDRGKVRLSMKVVDQNTGEDLEAKQKAEGGSRAKLPPASNTCIDNLSSGRLRSPVFVSEQTFVLKNIYISKAYNFSAALCCGH